MSLPFALNLIGLWLLAPQPPGANEDSEVVVRRQLAQLAPVPSWWLDEAPPAATVRELGLKPAERKRLLALRQLVAPFVRALPENRQRKPSVVGFVLSQVSPESGRTASAITVPIAEQLRVAHAILIGGDLDLDRIDRADYHSELSLAYRLPNESIEAGLWTLVRHRTAELYAAVAEELDAAAFAEGTLSHEAFAERVLLPFFRLIPTPGVVAKETERQILRAFEQRFSTLPENNVTLEKAVSEWRDYLVGGEWDAATAVGLNRRLFAYQLHISWEDDTVSVERILPWRASLEIFHVGSAYLLERLGVNPRSEVAGVSLVSDREVWLYLDAIDCWAAMIEQFRANSTKPTWWINERLPTWRRLSPGLTPKLVNEIGRTLMAATFADDDTSAIRGQLIRETLIHELKHKWDEQIALGLGWRVVDFEISAELTTAIAAAKPEYQIFSLIDDATRLLARSGHPGVSANLRSLIKTLWRIARAAHRGELAPSEIKRELRELYTTYRTTDGSKLPQLDEFLAAIGPVLAALPTYPGEKTAPRPAAAP